MQNEIKVTKQAQKTEKEKVLNEYVQVKTLIFQRKVIEKKQRPKHQRIDHETKMNYQTILRSMMYSSNHSCNKWKNGNLQESFEVQSNKKSRRKQSDSQQ